MVCLKPAKAVSFLKLLHGRACVLLTAVVHRLWCRCPTERRWLESGQCSGTRSGSRIGVVNFFHRWNNIHVHNSSIQALYIFIYNNQYRKLVPLVYETACGGAIDCCIKSSFLRNNFIYCVYYAYRPKASIGFHSVLHSFGVNFTLCKSQNLILQVLQPFSIMIAVSEASNRSNTKFRPLLKFDKWPGGRKWNKAYAVLTQHPAYAKQAIGGRPPIYGSAPCKLTISSYLFARWHLYRHVGYLRHQQQVDLWPIDLESGVRVTCDVPIFVPILVFLCIAVLELGPMYATDRRQTSETSDKTVA